MKRCLLFMLLCAALLVGCGQARDRDDMDNAYRQVSQEEAAALMASEEDYVLLDVRTPTEFAEGHIPGAVCLPNETIGTDNIPQLPDKDQLILVYCRTGRRSKDAARKLSDLGYTQVVEFGGISTWEGPIEEGS